ncbi:hypothetical protein S40285_07881 [Stachybotrys chlorohalonatus IBT 40285]|uniref:CFEM domain-containing protein n=1 Tax=Stachybotrys chlorohalonatus (strain IBT 40285) TaxID=1283841 RepID=A0A084Q8Y8_STAC4|nr:hypothetical protein S40285_07881 [Stachybotrys chlorohalonata IBT 40285]
MLSLYKRLLLACLTAAASVVAVDEPPSLLNSLAQMPNCAQTCVLGAVTNSTCLPTNLTCVCSDDELQDAAQDCVRATCTPKEALVTWNITQVTCGAPVRDVRQSYVILNDVFGVIIVLSVFQRIVTKLYWKLGIDKDDWCILLMTILLTIPSTVIGDHGLVANGMGLDIWTLQFDQITRFSTWFHVMAVLYFMQISLIKLSALFFYLRVFPVTKTRYIIIGTIVFNCMYGVIFIFVTVFQCLPVGYLSVRWMEEDEGSCINVNAMTWSNAGISIAVDIWMLFIPLLQIRSLQLSSKKKLGAALMFVTGTAFTVISVIRLHTLVKFNYTDNATYTYIEISQWSIAEVSVGVVCVCMPSYRLLFVRLFRDTAGSRHQFSSNSTTLNSHSYARTKEGQESFRASQLRSADRLRSESRAANHNRKYGIGGNDIDDDIMEDETTLVHMTNISIKSADAIRPMSM